MRRSSGLSASGLQRPRRPASFDEKRLQLKKMAEVEGSRLLRLPLFQKAAIVPDPHLSDRTDEVNSQRTHYKRPDI